MRNHRGGIQEIDVQNLGKNRTAFAGISDHHVDHFVIPGVAQGFLKGAVHERSAQHQGMKLAFDVGSMGGLQMRFDFRASRLETLEQPVQQGHNGPLQCVEGLTLDLLAISGGAGANA